MRKKEREIIDRSELDDILTRGEICHLAMIDGDEPYMVAMNYGHSGDSIFFHCAKEGRKVDVLRRNPKVCFAIETGVRIIKGEKACRWTTSFTSVVGTGTAHLLEDAKEIEHGLDVIMSHYDDGPFEYDPRSLDLTCVIRVDIQNMTGKRSKY